jgi:hypothetical protein
MERIHIRCHRAFVASGVSRIIISLDDKAATILTGFIEARQFVLKKPRHGPQN